MYQFGPYKLDPTTIRLFKDGVEVEVEPQVFNTLLLLIEQRHRVITKDQLLADIWHGRAVTDHVITRIVYELRKILDEKSEQASYIRTVRGKGYQFVGEVTENEGEVKQSKQKYQLVLLGLVLVMLVIVFNRKTAMRPSQSAHKGVQNNYPIVAVLPIRSESSSEELATLAQSIVDYLTTELSVNLRMKVINPDNMMFHRNQFDDIWSIQKATRASFIIEGFLETVSENAIKIHLTLYKKSKDSELTPYALGGFDFPYPRTTKDLNDLYKQRKVTVREIVHIIKPGIVISDDGVTETHDPEAYRMVIAAHHIMRSDSCNEIYRAEELLVSATQRDPEFAHAWNQLFSNYFKRIWVCGESTDNYQKALEVAEIVEKLAPNRYKSVAIGRNGMLIESNQVELAFSLVKDSDWDDPDALYRKVYALRYAGFLELASEHVDRMLQLDPFYFNEKPIHQAPNTILYLNRFEDHIALLAEPGNAYHDYYRGLNLLLSDQLEQAELILQDTVNRTPDDLFGQFSKALLLTLRKQQTAAINIIDAIVSRRLEKNHSDGEMTYKLAQLYALAGDQNKAISQLRLAVNQGFFPVNYFKTDPAIETLRNHVVFQNLLQQAQIRHLKFAQQFGLNPES